MLPLLLLPLLLLPSIQGQTCDMVEVEERITRMEKRMTEGMAEIEVMKKEMRKELDDKMKEKEEEMEAKLEKKEATLRKEIMKDLKEKSQKREEKMEANLEAMEAKLKGNEAELRNELASKEKVASAVTQGLLDLPYLNLCTYQDIWTGLGTITYDKFLTKFNNGDRPGGADGQLDLGTGVFTCLSTGIYGIT